MPESERIRALLDMLEQEPDDVFCRYALALEYAGAESSVPISIDLLTRLIKDSADYLPAYYQLGRLLMQTGNREAAIEVIQSGIRLARKKGDRHTLSELDFLLEDCTE
jgi:tetratricopeptide (TPR) repeat protein